MGNNMNKLKVISIFSGPGAGKSTSAAMLFSLMKQKGYNVELVTEYAKDVTWSESHSILSDQLYVFAKQNRRLDRLKGKVEWVVTDSPILLSLHYAGKKYLPKYFKKLIVEVWNEYDNYNFFLQRKKKYVPIGRTQTEDQAKNVDKSVLNILNKGKHNFKIIDGDKKAAKSIMKELKL
jgi:ABC-type oligopeptide transport system ATPase subunit